LVSLGGGLLFTLVFWLIWTLLYRKRRKRSQWAASRQLYLELSDQDFEYAVAELFRLQGFKAQVTRRSNDRGIDVYVKKNGQQAAVQCKQYKESIGPAHIREFIGALQGARLQQGYFVTTSDYSAMSREAAKNSEYAIHLVNGEMLGRWQMMAQERIEGKSPRTAFIPVSWWLRLQKGQKAVVFGLLLLMTMTAATAVSYMACVLISVVVQ
jgi:cbb3-type cytochrome oxidase subunit 3